MNNNVSENYRADLAAIAEGLDELMADLEDIRDQAQEQLDAGENAARGDVRRIDEALRLLADAADLLEPEEE